MFPFLHLEERIKGMDITLCFIKETFFKKNSNYKKLLDIGDTAKQAKRTHLCVKIEMDGNSYYIPLRNNLREEVRKFGRIGHAIPSAKRKNAGLDYRYALIINDDSFIEFQTEKKIPETQYRKLSNDYETIVAEFSAYVKGYIKAAKKKRNEIEPLYKESSLINFFSELGIV